MHKKTRTHTLKIYDHHSITHFHNRMCAKYYNLYVCYDKMWPHTTECHRCYCCCRQNGHLFSQISDMIVRIFQYQMTTITEPMHQWLKYHCDYTTTVFFNLLSFESMNMWIEYFLSHTYVCELSHGWTKYLSTFFFTNKFTLWANTSKATGTTIYIHQNYILTEKRRRIPVQCLFFALYSHALSLYS